MSGVSKKWPLKELIKGGEGETVDFKATINSAQKIAKILSAFANTKGGKLLVGIKDNGSPANINPAEEMHVLEMAANFYCKPEVRVEYTEQEYLGRNILIANVPSGEDKPYYAKGTDEKWWAYIRVHDQCLLASKVMLEVMKGNAGKEGSTLTFGVPEKIILQFLEKNRRVTLKEFCKMANIGRWRAQKILVNLVRMGVIKVISTEKTDFYSL